MSFIPSRAGPMNQDVFTDFTKVALEMPLHVPAKSVRFRVLNISSCLSVLPVSQLRACIYGVDSYPKFGLSSRRWIR